VSKVVISYSEDHFKPKSDLALIGGSGLLASTLFNIAEKNFLNSEVVYVDYRSESSMRQHRNADLLISISENIHRAQQLIKPARTILWAVNMPWIHRRRIVDEALEVGYPPEGLQSEDGLRANSYELKRIDEVITLGNLENFRAYANLMGSYKKVFPINFCIEKGTENLQSGDSGVLIYLGNLSFRKGIDLAIAIAKELTHENVKVTFIGTTTNQYINNLMQMLVKDSHGLITWHNDWIVLKSEKWDEIIKSVTVALFPTREEGQAAVVSELITSGMPTIYSQHAGLDWTGDFAQPLNSEVSSWINACKRYLKLERESKESFLRHQQNLLRLFGTEAKQLDNLMKRISSGGLWPEIIESQTIESGAPKNGSYTISPGHKSDCDVELEIETCITKRGQDKYVLVAACDKYQEAVAFNVKMNGEYFAVKRNELVSGKVVDHSQIKIKSISSPSISIPRFASMKWYWSNFAPRIYDRRLQEISLKKIIKFLTQRI
jgi:glycosyltransferase involved in cell wall biosynthesis